MRRLDKLIPNAIEKEIVQAADGLIVLRRWDEVVGPVLATKSWPDRYDKGVVWVAVEGSAWAQELRFMKETILGRLRTLSGNRVEFKDVRFGVRKLPVKEESEFQPPAQAPVEELSIREIAERRLKKWNDERAT